MTPLFNLTKKSNDLSPKFSFQWKIGLVIGLLSVSITSFSFYYYYTASYDIAIEFLNKNLRDVGSLGVMLFDKDSREALKRLKKRALEEAHFDRKIIDSLPVGGTNRTIPQEKIDELHASDDFKIILKLLRKISHSSFNEAEPIKNNYEFRKADFGNGAIATYIEIDLTDIISEDFGMYLVAVCPEPNIADDWPGNPIGNMFRSFIPFSRLNKKIYIPDDLIVDEFYQSLSATVPIFDENNKPICVLGLDYSVGPQLAKLQKLKSICFALIISSLLLSIIISYLISKSLNAPLKELYSAAKKVMEKDYTSKVIIKSNDEFGLLAKVFNDMVANIMESFKNSDLLNKELECQVAERTKKLQDTNEELKLKNNELETLSTTDMLTGLFNRRYIEKQIQVNINRSERYGLEMSLVMMDLDHFKLINDTYGHDIGDKVLVSVSKVLKENIRGVDVAGRWGGEEFIIILQANNLGALANAEKLRTIIKGKTHGNIENVSASFGHTQYRKNDTIDTLIKRADQGLYKAKKNGRNRVETVTH